MNVAIAQLKCYKRNGHHGTVKPVYLVLFKVGPFCFLYFINKFVKCYLLLIYYLRMSGVQISNHLSTPLIAEMYFTFLIYANF